MSVLDRILARTRREVARRRTHRWTAPPRVERASAAVAALRRVGPPRVVAEVKFRSPSAGQIRARAPGAGRAIARSYELGGAAAISVLADGPSFGGGVLEVRRVASDVSVPVLFKGFVVDPIQVELAVRAGASMVLLLARALRPSELSDLVATCDAYGVAPLVEAADEAELELALATGARLVGVNARDLHTFEVDADRAWQCLGRIPQDRVAIYMSGVRSAADLRRVGESRADAVLVGEGLMRTEDPGRTLAIWLEETK